jgi:hypothetical protein
MLLSLFRRKRKWGQKTPIGDDENDRLTQTRVPFSARSRQKRKIPDVAAEVSTKKMGRRSALLSSELQTRRVHCLTSGSFRPAGVLAALCN